jgi:tetratricopeptide (TPR) repeat protein
MDLKDPDNAIINYNEGIRRDPLSHSAYNNRGVAYNRKGSREQALTDLDHAMAIDPENEISKRNYERLLAGEKIE